MDMYRANDGCTYLRCGIIATIFVPTSNLRDLTVEDYINNTFFVKICLSHGYMSHGLYKGMAKFLLIKIISGKLLCIQKSSSAHAELLFIYGVCGYIRRRFLRMWRFSL